jgi:TP901 family phage tail tape measure protein
MNTTRAAAKQILLEYSEMAKELGTTTSGIANSAIEWQRQGYSAADTNTLIKNSTILAKVGMLEEAEAQEYLTSAMKGYGVAVEDSLRIVDQLTSIDMQAAVSAGGLAEAMSRTAASAKMAGVETEQLLAYLAITGEVTQKSMSQIGESYKTIFARFGNIKAGKFVDDETGEDLNDVAKVLSKFNIELYDAEGNMNDVGEILDTVGNKWNSLTEIEQNAIATAIAGTRQRENFIVSCSF